MKRRDFLQSTLLAATAVSTTSFSIYSGMSGDKQRKLKKGIMWGNIAVAQSIPDKFQAAKEAGFEGVEVYSHLDRNEVLRARDKTGLIIPSICDSQHWKLLLSDPDPEIRAQGVDALKVSIEDAKAYGADTVLLVPGKVSETVTYDQCWNRTTEEIKKALPLAEKLKIKIAVENVWNNFLLSPLEAARYVDQFKSKYVAFYFDCGNILAFGWPEQWIRILGPRIAKVHIKEYSLKIASTQGKGAGFKVNLTEGDVNWSEVMKALDEIGYQGWTTIEQPGGNTMEGLKDLNKRLEKILMS